MPEWKTRYPGVETLNVAVMGCIVNGPGESKHADIGISLPGTGETPTAPVFVDGKKVATLRGPTLTADFKQMVIDYIERRFRHRQPHRRRVKRYHLESQTVPDRILVRRAGLDRRLDLSRRHHRPRRQGDCRGRLAGRQVQGGAAHRVERHAGEFLRRHDRDFSHRLSGQLRRQQQRAIRSIPRPAPRPAKRDALPKIEWLANNKVQITYSPEPGAGKPPRLKERDMSLFVDIAYVKVE